MLQLKEGGMKMDENMRALKGMLLDIGIMLLGGILAVDNDINFNGFEYIIVLVGFISLLFDFKRSNRYKK